MRKLSLASDHYEKIVNGFISYYSSEVSNRRSQLGFNYNVLAEQCGNIVENSHTNLLMRLLQYRNKYGYVFLEDFISLAGFNIAIEDRDVLYKTEYSVGSDTGKKGRIDGIIYQNGNFAIIIENKINHAGNQEEQIKKYIESILNDGIVDKEHIFVVFLTRDGVETPDEESLSYMQNLGICDLEKDGIVSGPRYFPCSYSQHILDWLRDDVIPFVPQKDIVLNAGLIQYTDYLEGILGFGQNVMLSNTVYKKWFDNNVSLADDILENNAYLYEMYNFVSRQKYDDDNVRSEAVNVLKNLIESKNDELMEHFLTVTEDFFTKGKEPLMEKYHLNHHFTYYYITIRDKSWLKGIDFGWYPLGLKRLKESKTLILSFRFGGKPLTGTSEQVLKEIGYRFDDKSHAYRKEIIVPRDENGNETFFGLSEDLQSDFLNSCYNEFVVPIIKTFAHLNRLEEYEY